MPKKRWIVLPGGRIKRWRKSESERGCRWIDRVPPHWYRNLLNRRERRRARVVMVRGELERFPHVHPREAAWYW